MICKIPLRNSCKRIIGTLMQFDAATATKGTNRPTTGGKR